MNKITLTEEQERFLRENYEKMPLDDIAAEICVSAPTVRMKAIALGLKKNAEVRKCKWTKEQLAWLRKNYPNKTLSDCAQHIGYSVPTIQKKALELGLKKSKDYSVKKFYRRYVKDYKNVG